MVIVKLPDIGFVREALDYDPDTGVFTWLERPASHFPNAKTWNHLTWNKRFAGKEAGFVCTGSSSRTYWRIDINGIKCKGHRLAWLWVYGEPVPEIIDHINGKGCDNRIANLREATKSQNGMNQRISVRSATGVRGVFKHAKRYPNTPYMAYITANGKRHHLGYFSTIDEAIKAREDAEIAMHGEFRRLPLR